MITIPTQAGAFPIPATIKIGGFTWAIKQEASVATEGNAYGSTHYTTQTIFLDPTATPQKKCETLIHEVLHAAIWQGGISLRLDRLEKNLEEDIVRTVSQVLYQIIADNFVDKKPGD